MYVLSRLPRLLLSVSRPSTLPLCQAGGHGGLELAWFASHRGLAKGQRLSSSHDCQRGQSRSVFRSTLLVSPGARRSLGRGGVDGFLDPVHSLLHLDFLQDAHFAGSAEGNEQDVGMVRKAGTVGTVGT